MQHFMESLSKSVSALALAWKRIAAMTQIRIRSGEDEFGAITSFLLELCNGANYPVFDIKAVDYPDAEAFARATEQQEYESVKKFASLCSCLTSSDELEGKTTLAVIKRRGSLLPIAKAIIEMIAPTVLGQRWTSERQTSTSNDCY
jgi:hypothetical protein